MIGDEIVSKIGAASALCPFQKRVATWSHPFRSHVVEVDIPLLVLVLFVCIVSWIEVILRDANIPSSAPGTNVVAERLAPKLPHNEAQWIATNTLSSQDATNLFLTLVVTFVWMISTRNCLLSSSRRHGGR